MLDFTNCQLELLAAHQIGNKTNDEPLLLSKSILDTHDEALCGLLGQYFLTPFVQVGEFYAFEQQTDLGENIVMNAAAAIFADSDKFLESTTSIATHLYEISLLPQIKSGDLFVALFSDVLVDDELVAAIGLFKSENKQPFIKLAFSEEQSLLQYEDGINIDKLDKGCLIFNTNIAGGYKLCTIDKSNKVSEALFWKESFLGVKPYVDAYHFTKDFLNLTKNFVTKELGKETPVSKVEKIELLNRSIDYFKKNEKFEKEDFEKAVFQEGDLIDSFRSYDESYREKHEVEIADQFDISSMALKKQEKSMKSVLKLDKNFHIYIHGDQELIEQGTERDGRKFYKIYYQDEH